MPALLPWLVAGHAIGILLADLAFVRSFEAALFACATLGLSLVLRRHASACALMAVLAIAAAGSLSHAWRIEAALRGRPVAPFEQTFEGDVCGLRQGVGWIAVDLCDLIAIGEDGARGASLARVRLTESTPHAALESLGLGAHVRARLRLRPIAPLRNPGSWRSERQSLREGISARATLIDPALLVRMAERARTSTRWIARAARAVQRTRRATAERLASAGRGAGLLRALALGDREGLDPEVRSDFVRLGISHLLAVSGLHVAIFAGLGYELLRRTLLRSTRLARRWDVRRIAMTGAVMLAAFYAALAGWGVPVRRALLFLVIGAAALLAGRPVSGLQLLCVAALPMLVLEPALLFDFSAQLSFAASAALLLARGADLFAVEGLRRWLDALLRTSATAIAVTAPIVAARGGFVGLAGVFVNGVAVPWTGFVLLPVSIVAAVASWAPGSSVVDGGLRMAAGLAAATLDGVEALARALPPPVASASPAWPFLAVASAVGVASLLARSTLVRVVMALCVSGLLAFAPTSPVEPLPPRIVVFDVGLGDAVLVQGRAASLLVDGGRALQPGMDLGRRVVVPGLAALSVDRLDLVVASHADLDHRGGLRAVLEAIEVGELWLPLGGAHDPDFAELLAVARKRGVRVVERGADDSIGRWGDLRVEPLWPTPAAHAFSRNDRSLVVRVHVDALEGPGDDHTASASSASRVLLVGDLGLAGERALLATGVDLRSDVLKVGHHGSRSSSSPAFLEAVRAPLALLSAPCHSGLGLPSEEAVRRLEAYGAELWWTGSSGALVATLSPSGPRSWTDVRGWGEDDRACSSGGRP